MDELENVGIDDSRVLDFYDVKPECQIGVSDGTEKFTLTYGELFKLVRQYFETGMAFRDNVVER